MNASGRRSLLYLVLLPLPTADAQWAQQLPQDVRDSILWAADHETGDLQQWAPAGRYPGGGVLNTGDPFVTARAHSSVAHSGRFSAEATIRGAIRGTGGKRAVRLMRWTDKPWDKGGDYFPSEAYFSTWMLVPHKYNPTKYAPWDPGDGGWWNVFQFKANDESDVSVPVWSLDLYHDDDTDKLYFGLAYHLDGFKYHEQSAPIEVPVGKWFHVECYHRTSAEADGGIVVWQDGLELLRVSSVRTAITKENENISWGVGNYTDHVSGGPQEGVATLYFDDSIVSTRSVSAVLRSQPIRGTSGNRETRKQ